MKIEELNRLAEYRRCIDKGFFKAKSRKRKWFLKYWKKIKIKYQKNLKDQQRNTHIKTNKITNKKVICGFFAVEEKSHETEKKDEQQMRKVEKIEDDDEFSV